MGLMSCCLNYHCHGIFFGFRVGLSVSALSFAHLRRAVPRALPVRQPQSRPDAAAPNLLVIDRTGGCLCDSNITGRFLWVRMRRRGMVFWGCGRAGLGVCKRSPGAEYITTEAGC